MDNVSSIKKELHNSENEDIVFLPNKKSKYAILRNGEIRDMQTVEQYDVHNKIKCEEKAQRKKKRKIKNMHTNTEGSDDNLDNGTKRKHKQRSIENKTELLDTAEQISNKNENEDTTEVLDDKIKNVFSENKSVFCYIPNDSTDGGNVNNRDSNSENDGYVSDDSLILHNDDFILQDTSVGIQNNEKFKYDSVLITWEVPRQHTIESRITSRPNTNQLEEFKECGVEMKHGPFTEQEDDLIKKNWIKFCEVHDFNNKEPRPFLMFKSGDEILLKHSERLDFVRYLAKGLPNRFLYSIYQRFRNIYRSLKKGRFTVDEDEMILQYCNETRNNRHIFATLGNILNRNRVAVYSRYKKLTTITDNEGSVKWTQKLNEQFIQSLLRHCHVNSVEELSKLTINNNIWTSIGEELKILPARVKIHWQMQLYPCLFAKKSVLLSDIRIKLVKMFKEAKIYSYRDIIWTEVAKFFHGLTPQFLYFKYYRLIYMHVPRNIRKDCRACNKYLHKNLIPIMREAKYDRVLNHYTYSKADGLVMIDDH